MDKPNRVYVASSWRCNMQIAVVAALRAARIDAYDFRNPSEGNHGFHWSQVMPSYTGERLVPDYEYLASLQHPLAMEGYAADFQAMQDCDACILVLPCGRSAHLELGWFVGQGKRTAILLDGPEVTPELMYKMVDYVAPSFMDLLSWVGIED